MRTLLVIAIGAAIILGYGYYHAATHGWLYIDLLDTSVKPYGRNIRDAEIRLLDSEGKLLARGKSDQYGVVQLIHPEAGECDDAGRAASSSLAARQEWPQCFEAISTWIVRWADRIRFVDGKFAACDLRAVPVTVHKSRPEWWLWWVPLPHVGGKPLTYFSLSVPVNRANCTSAAAPTINTLPNQPTESSGL
jgi:hypothetical protein